MRQHDEKPGTDAWLSLRMNHFTASEAPAMMGESKFQARSQLLDQKKSGVAPEISEHTQKLFDRGHETEASARVIAEREIGEDFYPVVGSLEFDGLPLLASFDGLTMMGELGFEHKLWNASKALLVQNGYVPDSDVWQLEQQLLVSDADEILYVISDGTDEQRTSLRYVSNADKRKQLIEGWKQFQRDLKTHDITQAKPQATASAIDSLPALFVEVTGMVTESNLAEYKERALAFVQSINTDLTTDQDFADADSAVKFLGKAEKALDDAKTAALSKTASIEELFRTLDDLKGEMRKKRLALNKQVTDQKQSMKHRIVAESNAKLVKLIYEINSGLVPYKIPPVCPDPAGAMKGKSSLGSIRDAVDTDRSKTEQEAHKWAAHVAASARIIAEQTAGYEALFPDREPLALKDHDDLKATITARISEHKQAEEKRIEAARAAERQKIEAEQSAKDAAAERAREAEAIAAKKAAHDVELRKQKAAARAEAASRQSEQQKPEPVQHKLDRDFQQPAKKPELTDFQRGYIQALNDHGMNDKTNQYIRNWAA